MSQTAQKRQPPFAAQIDRESDLVQIYCGAKAWNIAKPGDLPDGRGRREASLVYPKNSDPADYDWPVRGKQVLVLAGDDEPKNVAILVVELLNAGAEVVHLYDPREITVESDDGLRTFTKPDAQ